MRLTKMKTMRKQWACFLGFMMLCSMGMAAGRLDTVSFSKFKVYADAVQYAKKEHKYIIIDFYTDWCVPCKKMDKEVLQHPQTAYLLAGQFILLQLNAEKGEGLPLARKHKIQAYPTFVVLNPDEQEVGRVTGAQPISLFAENIKKTINVDRTDEQIIKRYAAMERSPELVNDYAFILMKKGEEASGFEVIADYYANLTLKQRLDPVNWFVFNRYTIDRQHPRIADLFAHQAEYRQSLGDQAVDNYFTKMIRRDLMYFVLANTTLDTEKDQLLYQDVLHYFEEAGIQEHPEIMPLAAIAKANMEKLPRMSYLQVLQQQLPKLNTIQVLMLLERLKPDHSADSVAVNALQEALLLKYIPEQSDYAQRRLNRTLTSIRNVNQKNGVQFEHLPFKTALGMAKLKDKYLFVDVYATWCGPCKQMDMDVFAKDEVGEFMHQHVVPLKMDGESGEGKAFLKEHNITAYPTFLVFNKEGKEVGRLVGVYAVNTFIEKLKSFMQ
ncbi:thioredoxin fold domain-containing protein [Sphingobacterium humi]|uniref:Thioredoxin fold domain-containing protein n=2 Tax=Sphingobacterium humi TaxID=1796905 RepID=A0A6N8KUP0_9SPHI|nr:thioredoxin fold domain-containing protein [Sphingobacterium humi]